MKAAQVIGELHEFENVAAANWVLLRCLIRLLLSNHVLLLHRLSLTGESLLVLHHLLLACHLRLLLASICHLLTWLRILLSRLLIWL